MDQGRTVIARRAGRWLVAVALIGIPAAVLAVHLVTAIYLRQTSDMARNTLGLAVSALQGQLDRYRSLPELLADRDDFRALVRDPGNVARVAAMNAYLTTINDRMEASDTYVLQSDGTTIAASNHDQDVSFVGENFAYRPYYYDAMAGANGRFFALGTTSLKRGYYFSSPIRTPVGIAGVVVIKVDIDAIERSWHGGDTEIIVTDPEGIIFMSGRHDWLFRSILPLTVERRARTAATRRYADAQLTELPVSLGETGQGEVILSLHENSGPRDYLMVSEQMQDADWTVRVLVDAAAARRQALATVALIVLAGGLVAMGLILWRQRRQQQAERLAHQHEVREQLERRVARRTRDLAAVNARLEAEVAERRATEQELRQTQSGLVQAGKLAALGQMSAALSHEFNQPLAALRSYADSAGVLIDRGRLEDGRQYIHRIGGLVERMSAISRHLSNFARNPGEKLGPVALDQVIGDALAILEWRIRADGVEVAQDLGPAPPAVRAGQVRLQQVLVNILSNALDAMEDMADRRITIAARDDGPRIALAVRDSGPGVAPGVIDRIFDPFFSTKGVGRGLGLGLSISYNIVKDFGGDLSLANPLGGGAEFTITLDRADSEIPKAAE